jgi:hypothetical protein
VDLEAANGPALVTDGLIVAAAFDDDECADEVGDGWHLILVKSMLVLIRNIAALNLNVIPCLSQYRFVLDLALSGCVAHTIKSWPFPYTSKTHFPLLGTQYINDVWLCALASRAPGWVVLAPPGPKVCQSM